MRKVKLRMNEQFKYENIKELVDHGGNKKRTSLKLNISIRQVNRLIIIYKEKGKSGFIHGNRSKKPVKTLDKSISEDIVLLYKNKYQGFNFTHFKEYLEAVENIYVSYNFIYNTFKKNEIIFPKAKKITKKNYKKELLIKERKIKNKSDEDIENIINHEIALEDSHPRQEKPKYFGENIEMDGSIHNWFGDKKSCLHLSVDKATNNIMGGFFDRQETLNGYYNVFYQILIKYGIPYGFTTDNRTVFNYERLNESKRTSDKDVLTQFGYACKILGTNLITTSVSQAKGLIERDNSTFQDRLVNELKLNNITTIDKANEYLINIFIPKFNKKFALNFENFESVFEKSPEFKKINYILAVLTPRKIDNGNSIKYKNIYYQPYENNNIVCFKPKTECLVINAFNGDILVSIDEKVYELKKLSRNERFSENFDYIPNIPASEEKKKYIPPMTHPWKINAFKKQLEKAHTKHVYA